MTKWISVSVSQSQPFAGATRLHSKKFVRWYIGKASEVFKTAEVCRIRFSLRMRIRWHGDIGRAGSGLQKPEVISRSLADKWRSVGDNALDTILGMKPAALLPVLQGFGAETGIASGPSCSPTDLLQR